LAAANGSPALRYSGKKKKKKRKIPGKRGKKRKKKIQPPVNQMPLEWKKGKETGAAGLILITEQSAKKKRQISLIGGRGRRKGKISPCRGSCKERQKKKKGTRPLFKT